METNSLFKDFAIDFAIEVLPTPGGPTKQIIEPFWLLEIFLKAIDSIILSLTSLSPKWSLSKIFLV